VIGLLRSLDVSLPTIAEVLSGASVRGVLGDVRDQMEADLARRVRALQTVERMLALGMPSADVSVLQRPALDVAVIRDTSTLQGIAATTSACVTGLLRAFEAGGVELTGPIVGIFPLDLPTSCRWSPPRRPNDPSPERCPDVLPGGSFASATHVGPYEHIGLTAHALLAWCAEHGHVPTGPLREVYASDPRSTRPEQLVTHLMLNAPDLDPRQAVGRRGVRCRSAERSSGAQRCLRGGGPERICGGAQGVEVWPGQMKGRWKHPISGIG
jgi:hypothetical protein